VSPHNRVVPPEILRSGGSSHVTHRDLCCQTPHCPESGSPGDRENLSLPWFGSDQAARLKRINCHFHCLLPLLQEPHFLRAKGDRLAQSRPVPDFPQRKVLACFLINIREWLLYAGPPPHGVLLDNKNHGSTPIRAHGGRSFGVTPPELCFFPLRNSPPPKPISLRSGASVFQRHRRVIPRSPGPSRRGDSLDTRACPIDPESAACCWRWCPVSETPAQLPTPCEPESNSRPQCGGRSDCYHQRRHMAPSCPPRSSCPLTSSSKPHRKRRVRRPPKAKRVRACLPPESFLPSTYARIVISVRVGRSDSIADLRRHGTPAFYRTLIGLWPSPTVQPHLFRRAETTGRIVIQNSRLKLSRKNGAALQEIVVPPRKRP